MSDEAVFQALASPARRELLDRLFEADGQTLGALAERLAMTRFGVMKHLAVLEDASLIVTQRAGREKRHYLNAVPIVEVYDRWVSKYAERWSRALLDLRSALERGSAMEPDARRHVFALYIRTTPAELWAALVSGEVTRSYFWGTAVESDWVPGSSVRFRSPEGKLQIDGEVIEVDAPRRLVYTWHVNYEPEMAAEPSSRVTWEITEMGESCKLVLTHDQFPAGSKVYEHVALGGWGYVLSALKTYLETGEPLAIPAA